MKLKNKQIFTEKYWRCFFVRVFMYTAVTAFAVIVAGVLVLPVAMAILYSGWFLFLYLAYLIFIILAAAFAR